MTNKNKNSLDHDEEASFSSRKSKVLSRNASIRLQIQARGPICRARKRVASRGSSDESDFMEQFAREGCPDDEGLWLSSGSSSPSCCFDDQIFGKLLELSLDDWLVSLLILPWNSSPILSRCSATTSFDGSQVNPLEEAYFVLGKTRYEEEILDRRLEEEVTSWLLSSLDVEYDSSSSATTCSECAESFSDQSYEDCRFFGHSLQCKRDLELLQILEIHNLGFSGSLIDLDDENSEWISDSELSFLQIDVPSPSSKSSWRPNSQSSVSGVASSIEYAAEAECIELADTEIDEPLFWPSNKILDWSSEFSWDFFIMSPSENIIKAGKSKGKLLECIKLVVQDAKMNFREENKVWSDSKSGTNKSFGSKDVGRLKN